MSLTLNRRRFLQTLCALGAALPLSLRGEEQPIVRPIHSTGEMLPAIGMGTWITFNVADEWWAIDTRVQILRTFFERGGALIDSSPMYGSSEKVVGRCLRELENDDNLFSATKVWTWGEDAGKRQMEDSRQLWGVERFDLMQVHNLLDWQSHLPTLKAWKEEGRIRYLGVTTSHGRRHRELEQLMRDEPLDFVQFTYNMIDREAEQRLLPLAAERGISVIINRPFRGGGLFDYVEGKPLPGWAGEIGVEAWSQAFLKFIISHPAVTCAIPATSRVDHMQENMGALYGPLPDAELRQRMARDFEALR